MDETGRTEPIEDFEGRVSALRIAHGPGCMVMGQTALADLSVPNRLRVVREALRRQRQAKMRREVAAGRRESHEFFLNSMAEALLRLPDGDRERRLARCPKVLRTHVMPMIAEYLADTRDFLAQAGIPGDGILPD